jgi:hypothetical protein
MNGNMIVLVITVMASLLLAARAFRSRRLDFGKTAMMAGIWTIIIAVLAFVIQRFAA